MWIAFAFLTLGFLVGNLAGFSSATITHTLLGLLFAFGGGSAIAFLRKLDVEGRVLASQAIFGISVGCLIGLYSGIVVAEHQLLTPVHMRKAGKESARTLEERRYLRGHVASAAQAIDNHLANKRINIDEAYRQLYELVLSDDRETKRP